jgi:hypothetical protein
MAALNHNSLAAGSAQIQLKQCIGAHHQGVLDGCAFCVK